jgi:transposase
MLTPEQINTIHRLHFAEHWSMRKIARHLHIGRRTIAQYLATPARTAAPRQRASKLDPFKAAIAELLEQDAEASAVVIAQRLRALGFDGGLSILKQYLHSVRSNSQAKRAYVRMEPGPGERFEIDWGHFGVLSYQGQARKLYAFCLVECHSRKLFVEFTHSQSFESFVRCHIHAFHYLGGVARELWYDNLATAVAEHDGNLGAFPSSLSGLCARVQFPATSLPCAGGMGKRKNRKVHRLPTTELLASSYLQRSSRCESAGAQVARRSCRSTASSRNQPDSARTLSARSLASGARHHSRLSRRCRSFGA